MKFFVYARAVRDLEDVPSWAGVSGVVLSSASRPKNEEDTLTALLDAQEGDVVFPVRLGGVEETEERIRSFGKRHGHRVIFALDPTPEGLSVAERLRDERIWTATTPIPLRHLPLALLAAEAGFDVVTIGGGETKEGFTEPVGGWPLRAFTRRCWHRNGRPKVLVAWNQLEPLSAAYYDTHGVQVSDHEMLWGALGTPGNAEPSVLAAEPWGLAVPPKLFSRWFEAWSKGAQPW